MAASCSLSLIPLAAAFLLLTEAAAPSPSPSLGAGPVNLTDVLIKGGQFASFTRLLQESRVDEQLDRQLNDSYSGLTVFAPTDNAFAALKPGTLNNLSLQEQIQLVLFHVLSRYYSFATFETASNPLPTQASGTTGVFTLNVTTSSASPQANVSTGVVDTTFGSPVYADFPLAVYAVEKVLLPYALFGPEPPAAAPAPSRVGKKPSSSSPPAGSAVDAGVAQPPEGSSDGGGVGTASSSSSPAASAQVRAAGWWFIAGVGVLGVAAGNVL